MDADAREECYQYCNMQMRHDMPCILQTLHRQPMLIDADSRLLSDVQRLLMRERTDENMQVPGRTKKHQVWQSLCNYDDEDKNSTSDNHDQ